MQEYKDYEDVLSNRLNYEPPLIAGLTDSEIKYILLLSVVCGLLGALGMYLVVYIVFSSLNIFSFVFGFFGTSAICMWRFSKKASELKVGMPRGYLFHHIKKNVHEKMNMKTPFIHHLGLWDNRRKM